MTAITLVYLTFAYIIVFMLLSSFEFLIGLKPSASLGEGERGEGTAGLFFCKLQS